MSDASREAFEDWATHCFYPFEFHTHEDGEYFETDTYLAWITWKFRDAEIAALKARVEELEAAVAYSAGVWVSTEERLPEPYLSVYFHGGVGYWAHNIWYSQTLTEWPRPVSYHVTHWLDVKLPGGK